LRRRFEKIEKKRILILLLAGILAISVGGVLLSDIVSGANNSTGTITPLITTTPITTQGKNWAMMGGDWKGGHGGRNCGGRMGDVEVSAEYTQKVKDILSGDSDVNNLLTQGYNVTSIKPTIKTSVAGDSTVTQTASKASVTLTKESTGFARVDVDVTAGKVLRIEIVTRTVIDKSTS
jgi:hypothetical protein